MLALVLASAWHALAADPVEPQAEVVRLTIAGDKPWQHLVVDDLDALRVGERRYLPLHRLLKLLNGQSSAQARHIRFQFEGGPPAALDLASSTLTSGGKQQVLSVIRAVSEITMADEVYLPDQIMAGLAAMPLEWREMEYAYHATVTRPLSIWKAPERPALLGIGRNLVPTDLPSRVGRSRPPSFSLDFIDLQVELGADLLQRHDEPTRLRLSGLQQTFWGQAFGGGYKLKLSQPGWTWDRRDGLQSSGMNTDAVLIEHFDWLYNWGRGELGLGDANTGFNDLVFPFVQFTGARISGVMGPGWDEALVGGDMSRIMAGRVATETFEGVAVVGSRIELIVNDRVIQADEVLTAEPQAPPGYGSWKFEDIRLPPGALNEVRIRVTEPDGSVRQIDRQVLGTTALLPAGATAYLGGIGARRDTQRLRAGGFIGGFRMLHGVTDQLTLGAVVAHQDRLHTFPTPDSDLPRASTHLGLEAFWQPTEPVMLIGDVGLSTTVDPDGGRRSDVASFLRANWHVTRDVVLGGSGFFYGPDYFNGQSDVPSDRMGLWLSAQWTGHRAVSLEAVGGWVRDQVAGGEDKALGVQFQSLSVRTHLLPRVAVDYGLDRLQPDDGSRAPLLHTVEVTATPLAGLDVTALWAEGDDVRLNNGRDDMFSGLNLPSIGLGQPEQRLVRARYALGPGCSVAAGYFQSAATERASVLCDVRTFNAPFLLIHTEVGRDLATYSWFFENRTDWLLDRAGDWRVGLRTTMQENEWAIGLYMTIEDQLIVHGGRVSRTASLSHDSGLYHGLINPDSSGGIHGRVFIDADADGVLDPGEPGFSGAHLFVDQLDEAVSNGDGYYICPRLNHTRQVKVWLDIATIPATYSLTHAMQEAEVKPRSLTTVNLGITPCHSITGRLVVAAGESVGYSPSGVRVLLRKAQTDEIITRSITASNGSYYLDDLRPGHYTLSLDSTTLPEGFTAAVPDGIIEIHPTSEAQVVQLPDVPLQAAPNGKPAPPAASLAPKVLLPTAPADAPQ
jgi:hypothetical protein